jgi:hypothetical protein
MSGEFSLRRGWIKTGSIVANADSGSSIARPCKCISISVSRSVKSPFTYQYDSQGYLLPTSPHAECSIIRLAHWKVTF